MSLVENYGWSSNKPERSHHYLLPIVLKNLRKYKVNRLLDIRTGNGATLPIWNKNGFKVSAMEPDKIGFEIASKNVNADVRQLGCSDILPLDWKNNFDGIVSLEVIEHMFDPMQLAITSFSALAKDGILIVTTPYHGYIKNLFLSIFNKWDFHHHPIGAEATLNFGLRQQ